MDMQHLQDSFLKNIIQSPLPQGLSAERQNALLALENLKIPSTKEEYWKYTNLKTLQNTILQTPQTFAVKAQKVLKNAVFFGFVNGLCKEWASDLPEGLVLHNILEEDAVANDLPYAHFFDALNSAYLSAGVKICASKVIKTPVLLHHTQAGSAHLASPRFEIVVEKNASLEVLMHFESLADAKENLSNVLSFVELGENARLKLTILQEENGFQIHSLNAKQAKNSHLQINVMSLDGQIVRNNLNIAVQGENCETHQYGLFVGKNKNLVDNHSALSHLVPNCYSNQLFKGILQDESRGVFNGRILVAKDAQKINAFQSNANVLLSPKAIIDTKPELEIYANDVKCSHGTTTGQIDEDALFYLRARGLDAETAQFLVLHAFVEEVLEKIDNPEIMDYISGKLAHYFGNLLDA
jgi:Fe-S cluster assembly protein SufD